MLVAIGCDMARQCHLDTCPTGIATQREDLRAKFAGTPEQVERFALAMAESLRVELAAVGARDVGEIVGESRRFLVPDRRTATLDLAAVVGAGRVGGEPGPSPRPRPSAGRDVAPRRGKPARAPARGRARAARSGFRADGLALSTADRSFGARDHRVDRARRAGRPDLARRSAAPPASRSARSPGPASSSGSSGRRTTTSARACRAGRSWSPRSRGSPPSRIARRSRATPACTARRRPAPCRRPGGDALRGPELRRERGRRGPRAARLRVHDRRDGRRPRPGRRELRGRDDGRPGVPLRSRRPAPRRARHAQRPGDPAVRRGGRARTAARPSSRSSSRSSRAIATPAPGSPAGSSRISPGSPRRVWLVEPIAVAEAAAAEVARLAEATAVDAEAVEPLRSIA